MKKSILIVLVLILANTSLIAQQETLSISNGLKSQTPVVNNTIYGDPVINKDYEHYMKKAGITGLHPGAWLAADW